eukprot:TRINITY_DN231_c0_g2_i2.p1 TRINITY_DN231_c0_g2~~TRINITY_DN231_c0_g2_i2.p1  ORF type:complete len:209 (+),score=34.04 TRINITY_DN231_c0_g2_i2:226-852(+)
MKLAKARSMREVNPSEAPENFAQAILEISRAVKILQNSDDKDTAFLSLRQRAFIFRQMSNFEYALRDFQDALKYKPNNVEVMIALGLTLTDLGRCEDAIKTYTEALSYAKDKKHIGIIHNNMAMSYYNIGKSVEGEKHFSKGIKAKHMDCYSVRGMYRYLNGCVQKCIKDMNKAGQVADEDDISNMQLRLQMRGVAHHSLGQYRWPLV